MDSCLAMVNQMMGWNNSRLTASVLEDRTAECTENKMKIKLSFWLQPIDNPTILVFKDNPVHVKLLKLLQKRKE